MPNELFGKISAAYHWANKRTGGIFEIIVKAAKRFDQEYGLQAAASISYFGIFSVFPLLLFLVSVLGFFLDRFGSPIEIAEFITRAIPISNDLVYNNLVQILNVRGIGGVIGILGLIWAASSVFITASRNINRAWPNAPNRNILEHRLFAVVMIFTLLIFFAAWIFSNIVLSLIPKLVFPLVGEIYIFEESIWSFISTWIPWVLGFLILLLIYYLLPNTKVQWNEALWGAAIASILINLATRIFTWFLGSGVAAFEVIYGSLGAGFALVTWVYVCAVIVLVGAHISAAIAQVTRINNSDHHPPDTT
jgi:membrane protein